MLNTPKLIRIAATLLLMHGVFWILYVKLLTASGIQRSKAELFQRNENKESRIWIMGDSHPMMAVNPDFLPNSFNWAGTSEYYFLTKQKLRHYLEKSDPPDIILLPIDLHSFSMQGNELLLHHELDDAYWSSIFGLDEISDLDLPENWEKWWISARFFPYAGQYYRLMSFWKKEHYSINPNGFVSSENSISNVATGERNRQAQERYNAHFLKFPVIDSLQVNALQGIINSCAERKINLVLISFPVSDDYNVLSASDAKIMAVRELINSFQNRIQSLNYTNYFKGHPEYFSDPDHLNNKGAEVLSKRLKADLENLIKKPAAERQGI